MKKIVALCFVTVIATRLFSQTLFTYGSDAVSKDEFLRAYNKNKTPVANKEQSLKEYLGLYTKFKLKVKAALELRLDTLQQLKYDLQNFRSQVAEGYMNDEKRLDALVDEAIARSQKDIHLLHFYVSIDPKMNAADTLKAYDAIRELAGALSNGNNNYQEITDQVSKKYITVKTSDAGYITALSLPYDIENLVYSLKPGGISRPYRTKSALHLFKNAEERRSAGKWKIAQILLSTPPNASPAELKAIEARADSIYKLLLDGANFGQLAKQYSEDQLTYVNEGEMPEFGSGKFEPAFENKVFELKNDGEISKPILTDHGFHIVKRLQHRDIPVDKKDETFVFAVKQQILQDARMNTARADFLRLVKIKTGYKRNAAVRDAELFRYADSMTVVSQRISYPVSNKVVLSFAKSNVKGSDWLNFVKDYKLNTDVYKGETNKELLDKFIETSCFDYYRKHLEEYNKAFKYQMEEFKEGNMLFEIMERKVWNTAASDTAGLIKYYEAHKANYKWAASAAILIFNCNNNKVAADAISALQSGKNWRQIADESGGTIQADSGRYELTQVQMPEGTRLSEGSVTAPYNNSGDTTTTFIKVLTMFPENQQRSFEEAKGLVINDYQGFLEEKWVQELEKKYPITVNKTVFESLVK